MVKKGGLRVENENLVFAPIYGKQEIEVPSLLAEKTSRGYKLVPTLTKTGKISQRKKIPSIKFHAVNDITTPIVSSSAVQHLSITDFIKGQRHYLETLMTVYDDFSEEVDQKVEEIIKTPEVKLLIANSPYNKAEIIEMIEEEVAKELVQETTPEPKAAKKQPKQKAAKKQPEQKEFKESSNPLIADIGKRSWPNIAANSPELEDVVSVIQRNAKKNKGIGIWQVIGFEKKSKDWLNEAFDYWTEKLDSPLKAVVLIRKAVEELVTYLGGTHDDRFSLNPDSYFIKLKTRSKDKILKDLAKYSGIEEHKFPYMGISEREKIYRELPELQ